MRDAERAPKRPGQKRDPDHAALLDALEHLRRERALEHPPLELQAVDEERGEQPLGSSSPRTCPRPAHRRFPAAPSRRECPRQPPSPTRSPCRARRRRTGSASSPRTAGRPPRRTPALPSARVVFAFQRQDERLRRTGCRRPCLPRRPRTMPRRRAPPRTPRARSRAHAVATPRSEVAPAAWDDCLTQLGLLRLGRDAAARLARLSEALRLEDVTSPLSSPVGPAGTVTCDTTCRTTSARSPFWRVKVPLSMRSRNPETRLRSGGHRRSVPNVRVNRPEKPAVAVSPVTVAARCCRPVGSTSSWITSTRSLSVHHGQVAGTGVRRHEAQVGKRESLRRSCGRRSRRDPQR